jgi:hypothetical protein
MKNKPKQGVWHEGCWRIFQDMSLEEQADFWNDTDKKVKEGKA